MIDVFKNTAGCVVVTDRNKSRFVFNPNDVIQVIENTNDGLYFGGLSLNAVGQPGQREDKRTTTLYTSDHMFVIDTNLDDVLAQVRKQMIDKKIDESLNV